jgi:hypothetical protein
MEHSDFTARCKGSDVFWGVNGFYRPVFRIWGSVKGVLFVLLALGILSASIAYGVFVMSVGKPLSLFWLLPCLFGFLLGNPGLNGFELAFFGLVAVVGVILSFIFGGHHVIGACFPGFRGLPWGP